MSSVTATRMRAKRKEMGYSQERLADLAGTSQQSIARYEAGRSPKTSIAQSIASVLGVTLSWLLGYDESDDELVLTPDERLLVELYRSADMRGRETIMLVARGQAR